MGRHKIHISRITDDRARQCTFAKRRVGAFKKAMELSILCGCDVALITFSPTGKLHLYSSRSLDQILTRLSEHTSSPFRSLSNADYETEYGNLDNSLDDDEGDVEIPEEDDDSPHPGIKRKRSQKKLSSKESTQSEPVALDDDDIESLNGPSITPHNGHRAPDANNARNRMGFEQVKYAAMLATSSLSSSSSSSQPSQQPQVLQPTYTMHPMVQTLQTSYPQPNAQTVPSQLFYTTQIPPGATTISQQVPPVSIAATNQFTQPRMVISQQQLGGKDGFVQSIQQIPQGAVIGEMPLLVQQPIQQLVQPTKQQLATSAAQQAEIARLRSMLFAQQQQQLQQQQQEQQQQQQEQPTKRQDHHQHHPHHQHQPAHSQQQQQQAVATSSIPLPPSPLSAFSAQPKLSIQDLLSLTQMESVQFWDSDNCAAARTEPSTEKK